MPQNYKFEGWLGHDASSAEGNMVWSEFEPKRWEETDIDIRITHAGMCGSDLHTLSSGWYPAPYPIIVGHEIVGEVVRVGSQAAGGHKVGDRVGVGCLADNCEGLLGSPNNDKDGKKKIESLCANCSSEDPAERNEQFCPHGLWTYPGPHHNGDKAYGGYATHHRTPGRFAFALPGGLRSAHAATMMCAGVTMYSPLKRWLGFDPAASGSDGSGSGGSATAQGKKKKKVGIIGFGGLGHYGVLFARHGRGVGAGYFAEGVEEGEALRLGAHDYLASEEGGKGWFKKYYGQLDLLISTVASAKAPIRAYLSLLKPRGTLVHVGNPDDGPFAIDPPGALVARSLNFAGSCIGSAAEIREMLEFAAAQGITPWVEERPMKEANAALRDLHAGKPRYRYCLVNAEAARL
ncbi:zinc-binding alcohol dehydrogenase [Apiospora hydei]|uniref:Zinc-binding alcohol dehydrogenase n=1 Tax=Apiospora hydei TaxID=1337664 RepID=A0ABR1UX91_9PEZI